MNDNEALMTRKSLSLYLQVSERTIERWEKLGMPYIAIGDIRRYNRAEVEKWATLNKFAEEITK